jgi:hypothetical protein
MSSPLESLAHHHPSKEIIAQGEELDGAVISFIRCSERVEMLIKSETSLLRTYAPVDFEQSNLRKARALMDFLRASRALPSQLHPTVLSRLQSLRTELDENSSMLEQHLRATIEIAELITKTIRAEESDGTYSNGVAANR